MAPQQLPPEILAALSGAGMSAFGGSPPKKQNNQVSYQIPPGEVAGPEIPDEVDVAPDVLPTYLIESGDLPYELTHYQFGPNEDKKYIYLQDTKAWQPVPTDYFQALLAEGLIDNQGVTQEAPRLPDLEAPTNEDIVLWQQALPEDALGEIKTSAENDVALFQAQLDDLYELGGDENDQEYSNKIQELETKLESAKQEVSEYEALQYILYGIEPPESKKEWVVNNIVNPIISGAGKFFSFADLGRSQLGRRVGGYILANLASDNAAVMLGSNLWMAVMRQSPLANGLLTPLAEVLRGTDKEAIQQAYREGGSIGVWENIIAAYPDQQGWPTPLEFAWHAFTDTAYDPLTYTGPAAMGLRGLKPGSGIGGAAIKILEPTLRYTDAVTSLPGTVAFRGSSKVLRGVKTAVGNTPYWKVGRAFAPSRGGEAKLLRQAMGASSHKLEQAADEWDQYVIGKALPPSTPPAGSGGITPFPTPGSPIPPAGGAASSSVPGTPLTPPSTPGQTQVGGLTQQALVGTTPAPAATTPGGPQVMGGPQGPAQQGPSMGIGQKKTGSAPLKTQAEKTVDILVDNPSATPQQVARKLKVPVAQARELIAEAQTQIEVQRGPVQLYPSQVAGLRPYQNGSRILDRGYQSFLRGEERGMRFIEEVNPILQKYENDPVYNSLLSDQDESVLGYGQKAWTQKARAMSMVAEVASVYAKYFDDLGDEGHVRFLNPSYRGNGFGATPGGYKNEFTQALLEEFALGDHTARQLGDIERILRNTSGTYVEVTGNNGRLYNRSVGGLKDSDTGNLPAYAEDIINELKTARNTFEEALKQSRKAPKFVDVDDRPAADIIAEVEAAADQPGAADDILDILDNADDERTPDEVMDSIDESVLDQEVQYPGDPSGGFKDVETVIIVEDQPVKGAEKVELVETPDGQAAIIHKPKPSRATQARRKEAAKAVQEATERRRQPDLIDDDEVERLAQQTATRAQEAGRAVPTETILVDADKQEIKRDLVNDPEIPSSSEVMTAKELADWRSQNVMTTVITGNRGEVLQEIQRYNDDYLPSEGEFIEAMSGNTPSSQAAASITPAVAPIRTSVPGAPVNPAELFPTQQVLNNIGTEQAWRDAGLNIPNSKGQATSYKDFRSNVVPRKSVDLTNMDNKHVRYFRQYLARMHGLPKGALTSDKNAFTAGYEAYEETTRNFWDTMVRYARATRTTGFTPEDMGIEERGFFKRAPGKISSRPAKPELTEQQKTALGLFDRIFDIESNRYDYANIDLSEDVGVDSLATRGTNALRGAVQGWDITPKGVLDKDIDYHLEVIPRFDQETLGSETLQDMSMALDVDMIDNMGKIEVARSIYDSAKDMMSDDIIGYASSLDEAKLMVLKDLKLLELKVTKPSKPFRAGLTDPVGIVGPSFKQLEDLRDLLNEVGVAANSAQKQVEMQQIPAYAPNPKRNDAINYGGQLGYLNSNEVKLWDKRLDLDLANEEFMDSAEKKLLGNLQAGTAVDPAKIAAMDDAKRAYLIALFGPAAGIKNPVTYPKRVKLTDKVMIDVLSRVDTSKLGVKASKIYEQLGQTAAQRSKLGNIYMAARQAGLHPREAEDFILKVSNLYTGPPGVMQNWDTAVRHAYMYNVVKAPFNLMQDTLNDALVGILDGDASAVPNWARLFVEQIKSNTAGSDAPIVRRYKNADTPVLDEIHAFNKALGEDIYPSVQSQRGGRYDDIAGRYVEEGKSWWEVKGDSFGKWLDKTAFRGRTGTKLQTTFRNFGQVPAPSTVLRLRNSMDDMKRLGVDYTYTIKHYGEQVDKFLSEDLNRVARKAGKASGISMDGQRLLDELMANASVQHFGMPIFSPADIRRVLPQYVGQGQAEHLARKWSSHIGALKQAASEQTDKMLYSYTPTNLDEQVSRLWMFHYWATRASTTHARLAMENPFVMAAYYRAFEGTKRMAEEQGDVVPGWAKLFVPLQAGPYGMLGLVSPAALLSGLSVVLDLQGVAPNDFSWVDALQMLPMRPVVAAAMAATVSDRLPDPSGTAQTRSFVNDVVNFFRNTGIAPIDPGLTDDLVANATYRMQAIARQGLSPLPGVDPLATPSPEEKDTQDVKFYAIQIMQDTGKFVDPNTGQLTDEAASVLANIDAGIYSGAIENEALRQFSVDSMYGSIGKSFLFTSMYPSAEGRIRAQAAEARELQNADLVPDLAQQPSGPGDTPEFVDVTPELTPEQEQAQLALRLGDSGGAEATQMIASMAAYKAIGNDDIRETYESMNDAIYEPSSVIKKKWGGDGIVIGESRFFSWKEWDRMGTAERREWMDLWLQTIGQEDDVDEFIQDRQAFANAHPEIQPFLDWQEQVNKLGPKAFLDRLLRDSDSFRVWWNSRKVPKSEIRSVLMTESAYLAAQGDKPSLYDPVGVETSTSPNLESVMPPVGAEAVDIKESWASMSMPERITHLQDQERVFIVRLEQFNDKVMQVTGGTPYSSLAPVSKRDIDIRLERMGISPPEPGGEYAKYIRWANGQPYGMDVSIEAYVSSGASDQLT